MDMNAKTIYEDTSNPLWDKERITVELGYNSLKMDILIFKPKESYGKLDSIVFYPGANYYMSPPDIDEASIGEFGLDFIIKRNPRKRYLANINPKNEKSISFFKQNKFRLIQYTFELNK